MEANTLALCLAAGIEVAVLEPRAFYDRALCGLVLVTDCCSWRAAYDFEGVIEVDAELHGWSFDESVEWHAANSGLVAFIGVEL